MSLYELPGLLVSLRGPPRCVCDDVRTRRNPHRRRSPFAATSISLNSTLHSEPPKYSALFAYRACGRSRSTNTFSPGYDLAATSPPLLRSLTPFRPPFNSPFHAGFIHGPHKCNGSGSFFGFASQAFQVRIVLLSLFHFLPWPYTLALVSMARPPLFSDTTPATRLAGFFGKELARILEEASISTLIPPC